MCVRVCVRLECDDECRVEARTRQMALALQIRNPDVSAKLAPRYSEHVRATAQREPAFAQLVHDKLTDLVQLAKKVTNLSCATPATPQLILFYLFHSIQALQLTPNRLHLYTYYKTSKKHTIRIGKVK